MAGEGEAERASVVALLETGWERGPVEAAKLSSPA
jgi:hypothetical protein